MLSHFLKILFRLTSITSLSFAHRIGYIFGWLLNTIPNKSKQIAKKNIEICLPDLDFKEQNILLRRTLNESGKTLAEMGIMWLANSERVLNMIKSIEGEEFLKTAIENHKGVLLAMPHIGSWELVNLYVARHYPVTSLYKPPHMHALGNIIKESRQRTGATLVPTDTRGIRAVSKALKNGEVIVILPDQQPPPQLKNGIFSNFFNYPAYSATLMSKLAAKSDSEIIYAYTKRLAKGKGFSLVFQPASKNDAKTDIQHSVDVMNKDIETVIRDCPEQYQWTYKRFKHRPNDEKRFY
jgi:Kdo2-lipid IVA lauroyltransferase/acyltransferase